MAYDRRIQISQGGRSVIAENGPLRLNIQAFAGTEPQLELAQEAAEYSFSCLADIAAERDLLSKPQPGINSVPVGQGAQTMLSAVRTIGDEDLTPMAAVAGTIADLVADWLFARKLTKVIVDNGGDIAIRTIPGESVTVGLRPAVDSPQISHVVSLTGSRNAWGVNTSGLGGRSFTRGIASAVTAFAERSNIADAAATAIANGCFVDDPAIIQVPASSIDPGTDLGDLPVTVEIRDLEESACMQALANGLAKAEGLVEKGIILGAFLVVGSTFAVTETFGSAVGLLKDYN